MFQDGKLYGQDFEALRQGCIDNGELFTDPEFPPDDQSLYFSQETPFAFEWKRASEITDGACLFEGGATRFDINQGELGDCWLLAALANLTLNKRLLYQGKLACTKGQLISKCPYEKSVWTKYQRKYFCPGSLLLQG